MLKNNIEQFSREYSDALKLEYPRNCSTRVITDLTCSRASQNRKSDFKPKCLLPFPSTALLMYKQLQQ